MAESVRYRMMDVSLIEEIRDIVEDHIDSIRADDTADWHLVLKLAREALGEGA